jgi:hypothetical protein
MRHRDVSEMRSYDDAPSVTIAASGAILSIGPTRRTTSKRGGARCLEEMDVDPLEPAR